MIVWLGNISGFRVSSEPPGAFIIEEIGLFCKPAFSPAILKRAIKAKYADHTSNQELIAGKCGKTITIKDNYAGKESGANQSHSYLAYWIQFNHVH